MQELNTGQKIKLLREQLNLTLEQVGNIVGVGKSTVRKWETGEIANMRRDKIAALAKALHTTPAYLMDWKEETDKNEPLAKGVQIPVLGYVRAGYPIYAEENIIDYEEISNAMAAKGEFFGLRVYGNSMEPQIFEGDIVIVRKQPDIESGEIAVVLVNGSDGTVKKITKSDKGIMLVPLNGNCDYEPHFYSNEEIQILPVTIAGRVVEVRRKL